MWLGYVPITSVQFIFGTHQSYYHSGVKVAVTRFLKHLVNEPMNLETVPLNVEQVEYYICDTLKCNYFQRIAEDAIPVILGHK